jgi:hypothetical protein
MQSVALTDAAVVTHGVRRFDCTKNTLFQATMDTLMSLGYEIDDMDPAEGRIVTGRLAVEMTPLYASWDARAYVITVRADGDGAEIRAEPRIFREGQDVSQEIAWQIQGSGGEQERWEEFFLELEYSFGYASRF